MKAYPIENCLQCPEMHRLSNEHGYSVLFCNISKCAVFSQFKIPEWCKLDDYKEATE